MTISFNKYQGTGNDFIMVDDREGGLSKLGIFSSAEKLKQLCNRRFGIGADGVILLLDSQEHDFKMKYYNSDGKESSMCGNGGRCIVSFAHSLGAIGTTCTFEAIDGLHEATILDGTVSLKMKDVSNIFNTEVYSVLDTGSPHVVTILTEGLDDLDVKHTGSEIRNSPDFIKDGINVNFVEKIGPDHIKVRTYERGVEDETYSCGTGVTAASIAIAPVRNDQQVYKVETLGGILQVSFIKNSEDSASDIWLIGPAKEVFTGTTS